MSSGLLGCLMPSSVGVGVGSVMSRSPCARTLGFKTTGLISYWGDELPQFSNTIYSSDTFSQAAHFRQ
jgi:hypothetical protein